MHTIFSLLYSAQFYLINPDLILNFTSIIYNICRDLDRFASRSVTLILYELPCQFSGIIFYSYFLHKRKQQRNEKSIYRYCHHCSLTIIFITLLYVIYPLSVKESSNKYLRYHINFINCSLLLYLFFLFPYIEKI